MISDVIVGSATVTKLEQMMKRVSPFFCRVCACEDGVYFTQSGGDCEAAAQQAMSGYSDAEQRIYGLENRAYPLRKLYSLLDSGR